MQRASTNRCHERHENPTSGCPNCVRKNGFTTACRSEQNRFAMSLRDSRSLPFGAVQRRLGRGADVASSVWSQQRTPLRRLRKNPFGSTRDERIQPRTDRNAFSNVISLSARGLPRFSQSADRRGSDPRLVGASRGRRLGMLSNAPRLLSARQPDPSRRSRHKSARDLLPAPRRR